MALAEAGSTLGYSTVSIVFGACAGVVEGAIGRIGKFEHSGRRTHLDCST